MATSLVNDKAWLTVVRAWRHREVHLSEQGAAYSLCGLRVRPWPVTSSFRTNGCTMCLDAAQAAERLIALDGDRTWINLARMEATRG